MQNFKSRKYRSKKIGTLFSFSPQMSSFYLNELLLCLPYVWISACLFVCLFVFIFANNFAPMDSVCPCFTINVLDFFLSSWQSLIQERLRFWCGIFLIVFPRAAVGKKSCLLNKLVSCLRVRADLCSSLRFWSLQGIYLHQMSLVVVKIVRCKNVKSRLCNRCVLYLHQEQGWLKSSRKKKDI